MLGVVRKKNRSEKIPDRIWDKIFALIERLPKSQVLVALRIGEAQLQSKLMERQLPHQDKSGVPLSTQENEEDIEFCEVSQEYPLAYKPAKAFDTTTSVVELYRPDGMLMKIHICTDSFEELLRAFFKG